MADLNQFLDSLASANPLPGGGSAAALAGAMAAGLVGMVCRITMNNPATTGTDDLSHVLDRADKLRAELMTLIELDGDSYRGVMHAYKTKNQDTIQAALIHATEIPMRTALLCSETLTLAASIAPIARKSAKSDLSVGALIAQAGMRGAIVTAETNLRDIRDEKFVREQHARIAQMSEQAEKDLQRVLEFQN